MIHQTVFAYFQLHCPPHRTTQLDFAFAVQETMEQYGLDEDTVLWIIDNESEAIYSD